MVASRPISSLCIIYGEHAHYICSRLEQTGSNTASEASRHFPPSPTEGSSAPPPLLAPAPVNELRPGCSINTPVLRCSAFVPQPPEGKDVCAAENHNVSWDLGRLFGGRQPLLALIGTAEQLFMPACACRNNSMCREA